MAQDLSKRYYHNDLTYRDLENLEKQFGIKFENLDFKIATVKSSELTAKIDNVEKNLQKDISSLVQNLTKEMKINSRIFLEKLKVSNRITIFITVVVLPFMITNVVSFVMSLITRFFK
ncbi:Bdr family repetitive protein (plasmid) [Borreliella tanukii]|uniref:Bdr family repetitive protein n=1 Tax=Borreliella tanukii TaxID=56146 RepID=UPI003AEF75F9